MPNSPQNPNVLVWDYSDVIADLTSEVAPVFWHGCTALEPSTVAGATNGARTVDVELPAPRRGFRAGAWRKPEARRGLIGKENGVGPCSYQNPKRSKRQAVLRVFKDSGYINI